MVAGSNALDFMRCLGLSGVWRVVAVCRAVRCAGGLRGVVEAQRRAALISARSCCAAWRAAPAKRSSLPA